MTSAKKKQVAATTENPVDKAASATAAGLPSYRPSGPDGLGCAEKARSNFPPWK